MDSAEVQRILLETVALRVGPHTADYVSGKLAGDDADASFFVMGGDARTGRPVHRSLTASMLADPKK